MSSPAAAAAASTKSPQREHDDASFSSSISETSARSYQFDNDEDVVTRHQNLNTSYEYKNVRGTTKNVDDDDFEPTLHEARVETQEYVQPHKKETPLQNIVFINKVINFCAKSFEKMAEYTRVSCAFSEAVTFYSQGAWTRLVHNVYGLQKAERALVEIIRKSDEPSGVDDSYIVAAIIKSGGIKYTCQPVPGFTLLHFAADRGANKIIQVLLSIGNFDVNGAITSSVAGYPGGAGGSRTPILLAARNGHTETVKLLIKKGADPNDKSFGNSTPLHNAVVTKNFDLAKYLIMRHKVDCNAQDAHGLLTPLHLAVQTQQGKMIRLIVEKGTNVDLHVTTSSTYGYKTALGLSRPGTKIREYLERKCREDVLKKMEKLPDSIPHPSGLEARRLDENPHLKMRGES